jgi:hypothetical protein
MILAQDSVGKGSVVFLKRYAGLPEIVVIVKHRRADPQPVPPWGGGGDAVSFGGGKIGGL